MRQPTHALAVLLALCAIAAPAREVYKCTTPEGVVAYQDVPCSSGSGESRLHLSDAAPATASADDVAPAPAPAAAAKPPPPEPPRPRKPLPSIWLCTNGEDGSQFVSRGGPPPPRSVPLGVLGYPGKSLAQAYGPGSNVMSAPELSKPPIDRSPQSAAATGYTPVQDTCIEANAAQTCAYLRAQLDATNDKLSHARFKDEQARLQSQVDGLVDHLRGCVE